MLESDFEQADIEACDKQMLSYAIKLTASPGNISATDIGQLHEHGFDDRAIHDICCITAYFAFVNRVADGLGVELEAK